MAVPMTMMTFATVPVGLPVARVMFVEVCQLQPLSRLRVSKYWTLQGTINPILMTYPIETVSDAANVVKFRLRRNFILNLIPYMFVRRRHIWEKKNDVSLTEHQSRIRVQMKCPHPY
jgi:hypothetical protein